MKLQRFFIKDRLDKKQIRITDGELLNQMRNVFRFKAGDGIVLIDGQLNEAEARIRGINKDWIELEIIKVSKNRNEPKVYGILYASILKRENFELVVQKATEIGIKEIVPVISKRTVKLNFRQDRLEKIIKEAVEQSGRGMLPVLLKATGFKDALKHAKNNANILFDISGEKLSKLTDKSGRVGIWVGPEGGWSEEELQLAKQAGFKIVSLGKLTLRAETAAIIGPFFVVS